LGGGGSANVSATSFTVSLLQSSLHGRSSSYFVTEMVETKG